VLTNVKASIVQSSEAPLLLGQSALSKLGTFQFDYANSTLLINGGASGSGIKPTPVVNVQAKPWLNPSLTYGSVKDIDGNTYATIQIGRQVWMAENLRTTRYRNGDAIPHVDDNWTRLRSPAWCHVERNPAHEVPYGKLYNWYAVTDGRKLCPAGWHVPADWEWTALSDYLGGESVAGYKMKSTGTEHWGARDTIARDAFFNIATNGSGFSGLPAGARTFFEGYFYNLSHAGYWWSASEVGTDFPRPRSLSTVDAGILKEYMNERNGFSVRCLRD
jgi:uncharacterized protein (TIGR02145 family)